MVKTQAMGEAIATEDGARVANIAYPKRVMINIRNNRRRPEVSCPQLDLRIEALIGMGEGFVNVQRIVAHVLGKDQRKSRRSVGGNLMHDEMREVAMEREDDKRT